MNRGYYNEAKQVLNHYYIFFFFSSRRRHTRSTRDWSSDVCSSDLPQVAAGGPDLRRLRRRQGRAGHVAARRRSSEPGAAGQQIGRASCRESVGVGGGGRRERKIEVEAERR